MRSSVIMFVLVLFSFSFLKANTPADEGQVMKITKAEFMKKIMDFEKNPKVWKYKGSKPCVVDFYADWCAPCRKAAPVMEELSEKYKGKILFYKVNTDEERELASMFHITGIPAFLWVPITGNPLMKAGVPNDPASIREQFEKSINELLLKRQ
jgi:thioredoxin